ncbi:probable glycosyltransferase At3g07620 [Solanum tuberosum]|uniref:Limonene cyclase n=2 Tax=Solanum tuberosum TaxID=4113 RepID=M1D6R9_SOLTU|nr:PREDICTED: probable glycosyltransferase At3g07620 [Solanum tuberosum]XP_015168446.1 PREDICTED: probable glycosyltransferase At3g07620 [Solanum tuberosum]XP_015168447.1 PREDICTED: probable glycosyltransferase At3g07620 [Solanum tuberosum]
MGIELQFQRLCCLLSVKKLLSIFGIVIAVVVLISQLLALPYENYISLLSNVDGVGLEAETVLATDEKRSNVEVDSVLGFQKLGNSTYLEKGLNANSTIGFYLNVNTYSSLGKMRNESAQILQVKSPAARSSGRENVIADTGNKTSSLMENEATSSNSNILRAGINSKRRRPASISYMNTLVQQNSSISLVRSQWRSAREGELRYAKVQIENAPIIRNIPELHSSIFRNYSKFRRSYELMERVLKVYVYKEGEKPIFHQPYMRGIYASEGWFMKLMEKNKQFLVKDPKRAHLFYLPFSSLKLREALSKQNFTHQKDLENHLSNYIGRISRKYHFWNRSRGADHFLVACHDWAPRLTRKNMETCVRVLCNSNIAGGFKIGKDVSLPVTYVRSAEDPLKDLGGNPPSARPVLAFFAGGIHGYLRPILLQHWSEKEPDMKIFGPMPRDPEGKAKYRELMKSSKYCICAKGYEVHTPRVVESIHYECVPVIISDNYVPPFFEVLDWESFSVFVLEKDVPDLRNILLSIPEEQYMKMQHRLKIVQQYFLWHKNPVKYDLFHMILHSIWYNRVFQVKSK